MIPVVGICGIVIAVCAVVIATRQASGRDERKRSAELMEMARERWATGTDLDALARFYDFTVTQMYRLKHASRSCDHLVADVNLILELRNAIIETNVMREIDEGGIVPVGNNRYETRVRYGEPEEDLRQARNL